MHQAGSSRLGKALASLGCTRLFLSGCLEAPGVLGWSCPSYTWQPVPANSHAAAFGLPEAGQTASHLYLVACPTARALLGVARLQTRRRVEGSGGREGEKQETMREAPRPAGAPLLRPGSPLHCPSSGREECPKVPPHHRARAQNRRSPFCCRASWRLVSMSCSVAARLWCRLPAGLRGPWTRRQPLGCGDGHGLAPGAQESPCLGPRSAGSPPVAVPWVRGCAPAWRG